MPQTHASAECVAMTSAQGAFDVVDAPLVIEEMDKFANVRLISYFLSYLFVSLLFLPFSFLLFFKSIVIFYDQS